MPSRKLLSVLSAGIVATALAVSLAACTSSSASASCTPTASGASSEKVKVAGKYGSALTATFTKGLTAAKTQRTVTTQGKGTVAVTGSTVKATYSVYNASTGKQIDTTGTTASKAISFTVDKSSEIPGLYDALRCSTPGSRIVAVIPPADAFGSAGQSDLGVGAKDNLVFLLDIHSVTIPPKALKKANGTPQAAPAGYPTVTLASNGAPTITVPKTAAPTTLEIADLKKGSGATVKDGDTVTVQYTGVVWDGGAVFDSSWARNQAASFSTSGVIPGFSKALVGQKVGSQVIAIIPPADGYGDTPPSGQTVITSTSTLVFVVDILATTAG